MSWLPAEHNLLLASRSPNSSSGKRWESSTFGVGNCWGWFVLCFWEAREGHTSHGCLPQELKKEVMEHRLILDTVNEVSRALLELVPWRAREGLDKLVSDTNERYKLVSDTIKQRVEEIDAAIQRSQQVSE